MAVPHAHLSSFPRPPTPIANIADLPSRGDFELLERLGAWRVEVPVVGTADWHGPLAQWIDSAQKRN